jgi:hypothetical protein
MEIEIPPVVIQFASQIKLPQDEAEKIYCAWVDTLTFAEIFHKMSQAAKRHKQMKIDAELAS